MTALFGNIEALWLAPGEWLLLAGRDRVQEVTEIRERLEKSRIATADCSDRLTIIELDPLTTPIGALTGLSRQVLEPGGVARTRLADIHVTVSVGSTKQIRLIFDRTFAVHMRGWLDRAI
jgi:heterotetrameric sarcosine oxidase gamma subunit